MYVVYSRPNGWTDWVEWVAGGCYRLKEFEFIFQNVFFSWVTPGLSTSRI